MSTGTGFENLEKELNRLVESFGQRLSELKKSSYVEAQLRDDFLNPFFRALGWDMENRAGLIQQKREVREKATLQNAVTATDQQVDQLVYELYGLTSEEIALVEGA